MDPTSGELSLETTVPTDLTVSPFESDAESIKNHDTKAKKDLLEKKQFVHDIQRLTIELSQKNMVIDNLKLRSITRVEELEESLNDVKHQKQIVQKTLENQLKMLTEEMRLQNEKHKQEKLKFFDKMENLQNNNSNLQQSVAEAQGTLTNIHITEMEYETLKSKPESLLSLREYASVKLFGSLKQLNKEKASLTSHIQTLEKKLSETELSNHQLKLEFNTVLREKKQSQLKHAQISAQLKKTLEDIEDGNHKVEHFDKVKKERDALKKLNLEISHQFENLQATYRVLIQEHNDCKAQISADQKKLDLSCEVNDRLTKDFDELKSKFNILEDRCSQSTLELDKAKQAREALYEKYIGNRDQCKAEYQKKIGQEIGDLQLKTTQEIDRIQRSVRDMYERESRALKDNLIMAERAKEYAQASGKESLSKYEQLLLEMKKLQSQDIGQISELRSELKVKSFQLEQLSRSQGESDRNLISSKQENDRMRTRLDVLTQEVQRLQMTSSQRILLLESELSQKSTQLEVYEKLEDELDKFIVHAGQGSDDYDAERVLASYGMTGVVSTTAKRRLQQSLQLSKRLLDAERKLAATEKNLEDEHQQSARLAEELVSARRVISLVKQPNTCIIDGLKQRDATIASNKEVIASLESKIKDLEQKHEKLSKIKNEMSHDMERLLNNREEMAVMKQYLVKLQESSTGQIPDDILVKK